MKEACRRAARIMSELETKIDCGVTALHLDSFAEELMYKLNCSPAFKGYMGYPSSICVSVNSEVVHGIPDDSRILKSGDIVSIDLGVKYNGFYADIAATFGVGEISAAACNLIKVAKDALAIGISRSVSGARLGEISASIQDFVENNGYSVVRKFVGHGIGRDLHEEPEIPNFGSPNTGPYLENGMVLAIEPMVNEGSYQVEILDDGWTAVTSDGKISAHFEHTVLVWGNNPEVLTTF